jgi:predicted O-methyltransferase YrrM
MRPLGTVLHTGFVAFTALIPDGARVAEVGCYTGESTFWLLMRAGSMVCIDRWEDYVEDNGPTGNTVVQNMALVEANFDALMAQTDGRITKLKTDSLTAARQMPDRSFDCVYLDAGHEVDEVSADINAWLPKVKDGGILAGHDYTSDRPGVIQAVDDLLHGPDQTFPDGTWVKHVSRL